MRTDVNLNQVKLKCQKKLLQLYKKANAGHIGGSLSCLDILIFLFFLKIERNDKFILSKGHAALALYVVLAEKGLLTEELLDTFYINGTMLAAHPPCNSKIDSIPFGTGSLGHGLSLATGFAFADRFTKVSRNVYCILSEGDCDEGSTWEAAIFAGHHNLSNLFVILDNNNLQGFGRSSDILNLEPLTEKWSAFNFDVITVEDGNNFEMLDKAFSHLVSISSNKPKCIIAKTKKGNGVSFMQDKMEWHYLPMTDDLYYIAVKEIEKGNA